MNHSGGRAVIVGYVEHGVVFLHAVCPMRVTVEVDYVLILREQLSEALLILIPLEIRQCVEEAVVVNDVAFSQEGVALRGIEEGVEIEVNALVLIGLEL